MKTKRFLALVCVALTLSLMGVGVFAFQPPNQSPLVQYGAHQIGDFNSSYTGSLVADVCEVCGATGYSYVISLPVALASFYTGSFAIIDTTGLNRSYNGLYTLLDDEHFETDHKTNTAYVNNQVINKVYVFTTRDLNATAGVRYTALYVPDTLTAESGLDDFISDYVTSVTSHTAYSYGIISPSPVQGYLDDEQAEALRLAYNDGLIDGTANINALGLIDEIMVGVSGALMPVLEFEVLGVSVLSFLGIFLTLFVLMLIVKVIRS